MILNLTIMINMILLLMLFILNLCSKKPFFDKEKNSPFECGFDPKSNTRTPFSINFFLIAIIFLIFDIEIALILPIIKLIKFSILNEIFITMNFFILILTLGLYHEWNQGALKWLK
uniref:NADH-ubiquinone oxidoreductase chain 3 n=1 Tax=Downesia tarsata TaxID=2790390 RepID=A0A7T1C5C9_9CUCU|nr:NADH dehydrogenase subunit 3 [Downesia tarsata]QPM99431.1 NADH dehydrogenase subunit 3 [Downesia tarsata]